MTHTEDEARRLLDRLGLTGLRLCPRGGMLEARRVDRKLTCLLPADGPLWHEPPCRPDLPPASASPEVSAPWDD